MNYNIVADPKNEVARGTERVIAYDLKDLTPGKVYLRGGGRSKKTPPFRAGSSHGRST